MNLLVDTHVLLWSLDRPQKLPDAIREALESPDNDVWFSSISVWEAAIKSQIGQLQIPDDWLTLAIAQEFKPISFDAKHAQAILSLPLFHRDPFDRALIAQASCEGFTLVSFDEKMTLYSGLVKLLLP